MTTLETDGALNLGGSNGGNGGLMNGDGIWAFLLFALIFRNGNGGIFGGNGQGGATDGYVLVSDFATIERKLDTLQAGICDSTYALNNTITNGFFGVQNALCQGFNGINMSIADCCCKQLRAIDGVNFNISNQFGALNNTLCGLGRDIIDNQNANYRALHDEIVANKIEAKNERIAELTMQLNRADLRASQEAQNAYLISQLGYQCPKPAYVVQPPQNVTFPTNCCGQVNYASNPCGCSQI